MKEKVKVQDVTVGLVCPLQTWLCAGAGKNPPPVPSQPGRSQSWGPRTPAPSISETPVAETPTAETLPYTQSQGCCDKQAPQTACPGEQEAAWGCHGVPPSVALLRGSLA